MNSMEYKDLGGGSINESISIYNCDCMDLLKQTPDNYYSLAIVDPPYGISVDNNKKGNFVMTKHKSKGWDLYSPEKEYFLELFRVSKKQIIWGGNYFELEKKKGWICWDKVNPLKGKFSDFELAWTSFLNCDRIYKQEWIGFGRKFKEKESSIHPTQKPIQLYEWLLMNYAKEGNKILDTHGGSLSIAIAIDNVNKIEKMNLTLTACELDPDYFKAAMKRIEQQTAQQTIF